MIERVLRVWGVDPVQWRALVVAYLRMDTRRGGGAKSQQDHGGLPGLPFLALLTINAMTGAMLAVLGAAMQDVRTFATLLTTYAAVNTSMLLLVDFSGVVVSPDDFRVLGSRPVDSRTYFAARLCTILAYVLAISLVISALPAVVLWWWRDLGPLAGVFTVAAIVLCNACATVFVISTYAALIERVHPRRLTRALSYVQLAGSTLFLAAYYFAITAFDSERVRELSLDAAWWAWLNPASWFASLVLVGSGLAGSLDWIAAAAALVLTAACAPLVSGRLSLTYAERLGEIGASSEPVRQRRSLMTRLPGFSRGEARAVALLVRAQFRYDNRFRLTILSLLPITAFYILIGLDEGALEDPFTGFPRGGLAMYFATVFLPMTIQSSLATSDSWRAAWIFFATPADPARLIVAAKNFVAVWFLGGYLLLLAIMWSFFFDAVWHALVHAFVIWLVAHLLLQAAIIVRPALPFAAEPQHSQRTAQLFGLFLVGGLAAGLLPLLLPVVYAGTLRTIAFVAFIVAVTAVTEYALRLRAREAVLKLEFRN